MPLKTHVAAPGSTNSERLTARPAREGFVIICACTEPIGAGIGAVCVERGWPKWPNTMFTDTKKHTEEKKETYTPRMTPNEEPLFSVENQKIKGFAHLIIKYVLAESSR